MGIFARLFKKKKQTINKEPPGVDIIRDGAEFYRKIVKFHIHRHPDEELIIPLEELDRIDSETTLLFMHTKDAVEIKAQISNKGKG